MAAAAALLNGFCSSTAPENVSPAKRRRPPRTRDRPTLPRSARLEKNPSLSRLLVSCADRGSMDRALSLFETLTSPDTFQYNVMIRGYTNAGRFEEAIEFYHLMRSACVRGDSFTFPFVIKSCGGALYETEGETIHCTVIKTGLDSDVFVANSLVAMYAKLGKIESAEGVFREMPERDLVSWNSMIGGYVSDEDWRRALDYFQEMQALGMRPDRFSIIAALSACSLDKLWKQGKEFMRTFSGAGSMGIR
ncbi:Pentatricopeptide repeat-containing protein [Acorus calamus]|uniref:Pentatricopeptide repeat-containing protein n=1 Tax=Acorus calamus TaxID=4465 RepID=A0AAV9DA56_ACOCL|nr:Pentatricopeptide repeat-containing protein [Acorus calamus]